MRLPRRASAKAIANAVASACGRRRSLTAQRTGWLLTPAALLIGGLLLLPLVASLILSLTNYSLLGSRSTSFVGLSNYKTLLADGTAPGSFLADLLVTLRFTIVSVSIETILGVLLALYLSRRFALTGWLRTLMTVPLMIAPVISGLQWKYLFDPQVGMVNYLLNELHLLSGTQDWLGSTNASWLLVVVADVWQTTGFMTLFILAGIQAVPRDLAEAASVDGASGIQRFFRVTLPLIWPVIAAAMLLRAMDAFRIFDIPYVMTGGGPLYSSETVSIFTYRVGLSQFDMGLASASSIMIMIMMMILSVPLMRHLLRGDT